MTRITGRPHTSLNLRPTSEIAAALNIPIRTVERTVHTAFSKLEAAGKLEDFYALVRSAQIARAYAAEREEVEADFHPVVRCTSIECTPSAWA